jgi:WD40 repeat protein
VQRRDPGPGSPPSTVPESTAVARPASLGVSPPAADAWPDRSLPAPSLAGDVPAVLPPVGARYGDPRWVGQGGMGRVEVVHDRILDREVARKTVVAEDPALAARLSREARLTARLDHPGVVPVHDSGRDERGRPWYTMRLIRGRSLEAEIGAAVGLRERLALVERLHRASEAVAYAHAHRVVHRDLKPANLMVGPYGETLVVDWGVARSLDEPARTGEVVGTPTWMAPEQARGAEAGPPSDVWSLGRILEDLLTRDIDPAEPPPPELRAVVARACAASPADRYPDAGAFADDLGAWLGGRRVQAHAYRPSELLVRFVRTFRLPLAAAAIVAAVAGLLLLAAFQRTERQRDRAVEAEVSLQGLLAASRAEEAERALRDGDLHRATRTARAALALRDLPQARGVLAAALAAGPPALERPALPLDGCVHASPSVDGATVACVGRDAVRIVDVATGEERWRRAGRFVSAAVLADGGALALGDGRALLLDARGRVRRALGAGLPSRTPVPGPPGFAAAILDTRLVWLVPDDGPVRTVDCPDGEDAQALAVREGAWIALCSLGTLRRGVGASGGAVVSPASIGPGWLSALAWPAPSRLLVGTSEGAVAESTLAGVVGAAPGGVCEGAVRALVPAPGGGRVAVGCDEGPVRVLDAATLGVVASLPVASTRLAWAGDDELRAVADDGLRRFVLPATTPAARIPLPSGVAELVLAPDGGGFAAAMGDGTLGTWTRAGRPLRQQRWQTSVLKAIAFEEDGPGLFAGAVDPGTLRHLATLDAPAEPWPWPDPVRSLASLGGGALAITMWGRDLYELRSDGSRALLPGSFPAILRRGGARLFLTSPDPWAAVIELETGRRTVALPGPQRGPATISGDGRRVLGVEDRAVVWTELDGPVGGGFGLDQPPQTVALDGAGRLAAFGFLDGGVELRSVDDGHLLLRARGHEHRVSALALSDDGDLLLSGGWDAAVRRWDVASALAAPAAPPGGPRPPAAPLPPPAGSHPGEAPLPDAP